MSWISDIFGGTTKGLFEGVDKLIGRFKVSETEKQDFKLEFERLLQVRDSETENTLRTEWGAKERILVAELQQGDKYTKRARPSVVYAGLTFIALNYCVVPIVQQISGVAIQTVPLPVEFWYAWTGICGTWMIGRTAERIGIRNRATSVITGSGRK